MIVAIVVVVGFLAIGIVVFLSCRYCRRKQTQTQRRGKDDVDGYKGVLKLEGLKGTLGREYQTVPFEEIKSPEDKERSTSSLFIQNDLENVSTLTGIHLMIRLGDLLSESK